jgi:hypothetical protein
MVLSIALPFPSIAAHIPDIPLIGSLAYRAELPWLPYSPITLNSTRIMRHFRDATVPVSGGALLLWRLDQLAPCYPVKQAVD